MANIEPNRKAGPPEHVKAFVAAIVVAVAIPIAVLIVSAISGGIGSTAINIIYVVSIVVVVLLLVRWFFLYRKYKAARSA